MLAIQSVERTWNNETIICCTWHSKDIMVLGGVILFVEMTMKAEFYFQYDFYTDMLDQSYIFNKTPILVAELSAHYKTMRSLVKPSTVCPGAIWIPKTNVSCGRQSDFYIQTKMNSILCDKCIWSFCVIIHRDNECF